MSPFRLQGNYADESARKETLGHAAQCVIGSYAQGSASGHGPLRDRRALHHHRPYLLDGPRQGADCGTATGRRGHVRQVLRRPGRGLAVHAGRTNPERGLHLPARLHDRQPLRRAEGPLASGIDIRGPGCRSGGYFIGLGSIVGGTSNVMPTSGQSGSCPRG